LDPAADVNKNVSDPADRVGSSTILSTFLVGSSSKRQQKRVGSSGRAARIDRYNNNLTQVRLAEPGQARVHVGADTGFFC
jgi:hypothetical protein